MRGLSRSCIFAMLLFASAVVLRLCCYVVCSRFLGYCWLGFKHFGEDKVALDECYRLLNWGLFHSVLRLKVDLTVMFYSSASDTKSSEILSILGLEVLRLCFVWFSDSNVLIYRLVACVDEVL